MEKLVVAIDGPAGAGKSTIARLLANKLSIMYIDTGAMYRAVTLGIIKNGIAIQDIDRIKEHIKYIDICIADNKIYLNGEDVTGEIRTQRVGSLVSPVSAIPEVRTKLIDIQRNMAANNSVVMDGRDIGTNVLKDANIKIFLTASSDERAVRRYNELKEKGFSVDLSAIKDEIDLRDKIDSSREIHPLKKADDAVEIDTTHRTIDEVVQEIMKLIEKR